MACERSHSFICAPMHYLSYLRVLCCVLCDRNRPRSTRVNKRFLSSTVASAIRSRPSHNHTAVSSTSHASHHANNEEKQYCNEHSTFQHRQQDSGSSSARISVDKRKRSIGGKQTDGDSSSGHRQTEVYDVHEYVTLNKQYKLQKKRKQSPVD